MSSFLDEAINFVGEFALAQDVEWAVKQPPKAKKWGKVERRLDTNKDVQPSTNTGLIDMTMSNQAVMQFELHKAEEQAEGLQSYLNYLSVPQERMEWERESEALKNLLHRVHEESKREDDQHDIPTHDHPYQQKQQSATKPSGNATVRKQQTSNKQLLETVHRLQRNNRYLRKIEAYETAQSQHPAQCKKYEN